MGSLSSPTATVDGHMEQEMSLVHESTISFHNLSYWVNAPATDRRCCRCCNSPKQILVDNSGLFRPGMNAIMGRTGSGKTTMLDALAGRTEPSSVKATILVDGQRPPSNFKFLTGYVIQDDVVMGTLTVRENLMFSANLRLPESLSQKDKRQRVEETIQELGLMSCADTKIGTQFFRGVSGGERKRTNIGMELIIRPGILFLDEPTTGLDSHTANTVMSFLYRLSRRGRTVIFSIHQPRFSIYKLFDRLSLLSDGRTVFHGQASQALPFFESLGYVCEQYNNPSDFFLDVMNGDSTAVQPQQDHTENKADNSTETELQTTENKMTNSMDTDTPVRFSTSETPSAFAKKSSNPENEAEANCVVIAVQTTANDSMELLAEDLSVKFASSTWARQINEELTPILTAYQSVEKNSVNELKQQDPYVTSFLTQFRHLSKRSIVNILRNPQTSFMQSFVSIVFAVLIGVIFLDVDNSYPTGVQNRVGAMFFVIVHQMFSSVSGIDVLLRERVIFIHECACGFYRVSAYFLSKILCDFLPLRLVPLCLFSVIFYFMIGLQMDAGKFFIFLLTLFLTTMSAAALCFIAGATFSVFATASLFTTFIYVMTMIFGGLLVNVGDLDDWLRWLQYFSITRYSLNALSINELKGMTFYGGECGGTRNSTLGSQYLTVQGIAHDTEWDLWQNIMALFIIAVGLTFIAYIQLRRMKKLK